MHLLETQGLVKEYSRRRVVDKVDIDVKRGEVVGLLGPNGAGKTTTFYMITGIISPDKGKIIFDKHVFWKLIPIEKIRVGDKLKEPIKIETGLIIPSKRSGLSKDEINILKEINLKGIIKSELKIKYGIPGIPGMLMALLFTLFFGDFTGYLATILL